MGISSRILLYSRQHLLSDTEERSKIYIIWNWMVQVMQKIALRGYMVEVIDHQRYDLIKCSV